MAIQAADTIRGSGTSIVEDALREDLPVLDLVHLSRQTFGDPDLERDVLRLFAEQSAGTGAALASTRQLGELARLCHLIKGSARGVGAFELAHAAGVAEQSPDNAAAIDAVKVCLHRAVERVEDLLAV